MPHHNRNKCRIRGGLDILPLLKEKLHEHKQVQQTAVEVPTKIEGIMSEHQTTSTPIQEAATVAKTDAVQAATPLTIEERRALESECRMAKDIAVQRASNAFTLLAAGTALLAVGTLVYTGVQAYRNREVAAPEMQS